MTMQVDARKSGPRPLRAKVGAARGRSLAPSRRAHLMACDVSSVLEALTAGIVVTDENQRVVRANQRVAELFDLGDASKLRGLPLDAIGAFLASRIEPREAFSQTIQQPLAVLVAGTAHEWRLDAGERIIRHTISPIQTRNGERAGRVDSFIDVTEERSVQAQLLHSEKLRALGEVASGVVHDFNNLLAGILGRTEIMLLEAVDDRLREGLTTIRQAAIDSASTVRRIQEHVRVRQQQGFEPTSVDDVIRLAVEITQPGWKDRAQRLSGTVKLTVDLQPGLSVMGSGSELREVVVNMILNSVDAMPTGGTISISARRVGDQIQIVISDTGAGMDEQVRRHVFDPFFSTKGPAGTGLGLSIAYGIIVRHGGTVTVESRAHHGTTFRINLPALPALPDRPAPSFAVDAIEPPPPCRLLLLDDEPQVLTALELMLRQDNHTVDACTIPAEALSLLERTPYDVVITDLGMPDLNGWEVAARTKAIRPNVPVVLITGWGAEIDPEAVRTRGIDGLVPKPCSLADLRAAIKDVLQPASDAARTILVVDDQQRFADALAQRLELDGHQTASAGSVAEALARCDERPFDVAFVDLNLPDGQGTDLAAAIKQRHPATFVVLLTGFATSVDDDALANVAVDAILPKPWSGSELEDVLARATQSSQA